MARIMVIDDEPDIRQVISRLFSPRGHSVTLVSDGAYAMKAIRSDPPDLIILDVMMPELDGCALGYHLKFKSEFAKIPIVLLTSLADNPYLAKDIAADLFMTKPFDCENLVGKVEELLSSGRVKVGSKTKVLAIPNVRKPAALAYTMAASFAVAVCMALIFSYGSGTANATAELSTENVRQVGFTADNLFIWAVPVVLVILGYAVYILRCIAKNQNGAPGGKTKSAAAHGRG